MPSAGLLVPQRPGPSSMIVPGAVPPGTRG